MPPGSLMRVNKCCDSTVKTKRCKLLLVAGALLLAALACSDTEISYVVEPGGEDPDSVTVMHSGHLTQDYLDAAQRAENDRQVDYTSAGQMYTPVFPTTATGTNLFESQISTLESQGYSVVMDANGYTGTNIYSLSGEVSGTDWTVKYEQDADNPQLRTYTFQRSLDFMNVDLADIDELFYTGMPDKPPVSSGGSSSSGSSGGLWDVFSVFEDLGDAESNLDMWYFQRVLNESGVPPYIVNVTLPGKVFAHTMDGVTVGELIDGMVTLVIDEAFLRSHAGQKYEFVVQSFYLDCSDACTEGPHIILDENSDGTSCNCVCEKGWTIIEGEDVCANCSTVCELRNPDFVYDPSRSETNICACSCTDPLVMNMSGTACVQPLNVKPGSIPGDRLEGILQVILLGEEGHLWDISGWDNLSTHEQENLEALVEQIKITLGLSQEPPLEDQSPYPEGHPCHDLSGPEACTLYLASLSELARDKYLLEILTVRVQNELDRRKSIQGVIIGEIYGTAKYITYVGDVVTWWGRRNMTALDIAREILQTKMEDAVKQELLGTDPRDFEQAADELIKWIPAASTHYVVNDYFFYREEYEQQVATGVPEDEARVQALDRVQEQIRDSWYGFGRMTFFDSGAYATAFEKLDRSLGTGGGQ